MVRFVGCRMGLALRVYAKDNDLLVAMSDRHFPPVFKALPGTLGALGLLALPLGMPSLAN